MPACCLSALRTIQTALELKLRSQRDRLDTAERIQAGLIQAVIESTERDLELVNKLIRKQYE